MKLNTNGGGGRGHTPRHQLQVGEQTIGSSQGYDAALVERSVLKYNPEMNPAEKEMP